MDSNTIPVCLNCFNFPVINFITTSPGSIYIKCQCGFSKIMTIKDYFKEVSTIDTSKVQLKCTKHNAPFTKFCVNCNVYYCNKCANENEHRVHSDDYHSVFNNMEYTPESKKKIIDDGKKVIEDANKYLNETLPAIKNKYADASNPAIEEEYQKCIENNKLIIQLVELIIKNYSFESLQYNLEPRSWEPDKFNFVDFVPNTEKKYPSVSEQVATFFKNLCIYRDTVTLDQIKQVKVITEGDQPIFSAIRLPDGRILYGTYKVMKIVDMNNGYKIDPVVLEGHKDIVSDIAQMENGTIITGSYDKSISIWDYDGKNIKLNKTIEGVHEDKINKVLPLTKNRFATASSDKKIKIWSAVAPFECLFILEGHTDRVFPLLQVVDDIIISGSKDGTIKKWDLKTGKMIKEIKDVLPINDDEELLYGMYYDSFYKMANGRTLVSGREKIQIINNESLQVELTIQDMHLWESCSFLEIRKGLFLIGGCEGRVCLYNDKLNKVEDYSNGLGEYVLRMIKIDDYSFVTVDGFLNWWLC